MNKIALFIFHVVVVSIILIGVTQCFDYKSTASTNNMDSLPRRDTIILRDTIHIKDTVRIYKIVDNTDTRAVDSLVRINNEVNKENIVMRYKLERINQYVRIAGKGHNSKFLRGWILRVLNH